MIIMEGSLSKWTNVIKGWQNRWFYLDDNAGLLSYYTSREKMIRGVRRGCVRLKGAVIGIDDEDDSTFTVTVDGKTFHFQASDAEERERWVRSLEDTILRHAQRVPWDPTKPLPSMQDFETKLAESDAYLQIIIDQVKSLELRIRTLRDPDDRQRCEIIRDQANDMLEAIKHSIVVLQIAKNTARPDSGVQSSSVLSPLDMLTTRKMEPVRLSSPTTATARGRLPHTIPNRLANQKVHHISNTDFRAHSVDGATEVTERPTATTNEQDVEVASECLESQGSNNSTLTGIGDFSPSPGHRTRDRRHAMTLVVPDRSYSTSEEEDFYDATEFDDTPTQSPVRLRPFLETPQLEALDDSTPSSSVPVAGGSAPGEPRPLPLKEDGSLDLDALYEEESDLESSVEHHGSVVTHLLSQVKIGMDLTKVVLPTFILERRSLLEMYADYFAHPDIFVSITDFEDPRDRMIQVLRWYLSAYHAGRKCVVAKKPYNPILGEIFQCYWNIPLQETKEPSQTIVTDGPVPWCTRDDLSFIAEQVSHHPPISAFYAEHHNRRISFCAHVWTKSKFLGLSVGVHNIGQGCISVLDHEEEYIVTFPNGYGRSILTIPWIELGGKVSITCAKSGYSAQIEFHTKPFYGGKKHRITAEVFQPNDKKPFLTVTGEWNGVMEAKWPDGTTEVFIDVNELEIVKKKVRPISSQAPNESRNVWKDVTAGLRRNNIEEATNAKFALEERQREEARDRKERNLKWITQIFQESGENWVYKTPLADRLAEEGRSVDKH